MRSATIRNLFGLACLLGSLVACAAGSGTGTTATAAPSAGPSPTPAAYVADVDIGGRTLHIVCIGPTDTGRPTVIFESGLGGEFGTWADVMTGLTATDRGCSYDRAGIGMSEVADKPRTTEDQVADLHALLKAAAIQPPYVLVGHSSGGWNVMVYTGRFPDEVAGAVFVDVRPPATSVRSLAALPPAASAEPDGLRMTRVDLTTFEHDPTLNPEGLDLAKSAEQAIAAPGFGDRPLVVLTAAITETSEGLDASLTAKLDAIWDELQTELATLSTKGRQEIVADSGHDMPYERPDAVIDAVKEVLAAAAE